MTVRTPALTALTTLALTLTLASTANARPERVAQIPNGSTFSCGVCHQGGNGPPTAFGGDVYANLTEQNAQGQVQWELIFNLDSDGDGCTNGQELGDPDGTWRIGDADPEAAVTDPGDPDSTQEGCTPDDGNNDAPNNAPNNDAPNNDAPNDDMEDDTDPSDDEGTGNTNDDGGCSTSPGQSGSGKSGLLMLMAASALFWRRRRA